jgi:hypothetical protein
MAKQGLKEQAIKNQVNCKTVDQETQVNHKTSQLRERKD